MTVQQDDITFWQSALTGSTGGAITGVEIVSGVDNNLIPDLTQAESLAGGTLYRKWFLRNDNVEDTLPNYGIWVAAEPADMAEAMALGVNHADDDDVSAWDLTQLGADALISLQSDAADTRVVTVYGLNTADDPVEESVTLTGTTPVLTVVTFSLIYAVSVDTPGSQVITIKQGAGGTTRGTIPANAVINSLWFEPSAVTNAILRESLAPGEIHGYWSRYIWDPLTPETLGNLSVIALQKIV